MPDAKPNAQRDYPRGERNSFAKLSAQDVDEIRHLWETHKRLPCKKRKQLGITVTALAEEYGVHKGTISRIINRKNWIHQ